ncbi:hypothetical protein, partial [uncultured Ruminococcus sp.]|uniref:hypothetical protein n=1 Tax=uncultured Ruminococcus sp. TaxID=165186 RepID=UPI00266F0525
AFRGRSEQDRSALCPVCCFLILETFRWNVSNGLPFAETGGHGMPCPYKSRQQKVSCGNEKILKSCPRKGCSS